MLIKIEAKYKVLTPMFCAGANPQRAELRLPSFKGVLRFWWRALAWSRFDGNLEEIQRQEDRLFGSASGGQSRVLMRLAPGAQRVDKGDVLKVSQRSGSTVGQGAHYLGYGVMEAFGSKKKGTHTRACLRAPFEFTVWMRARDLSASDFKLLRKALIALGILGGMGAKSRKGYGSLVLSSLRVNKEEKWHAPQSTSDLREVIGALSYTGGPAALPEYTALSNQTRHILLSSAKREPLELLDLVGRELVRYRSWGRNGKILDRIDSEKNFEDDHDLMKQNAQQRRTHPRRIAFGLPHNYGRYPDQQVAPHGKNIDRRASPLFIHIHECGDRPVAVLSFIPSRFLPKGKSSISVGRTIIRQKPEDELYCPIHDFLDRLRTARKGTNVLNPEKCKEPFTNAIEVQP